MSEYLPEGEYIGNELNRHSICSVQALRECMASGRIVEAPCIVCDNRHNLIVDFGFMKGIIPRTEGAVGIDSGKTRDIALISRVNKPVCFKIVGFSKDNYGKDIAVLSRREAQQECLDKYISGLACGDIIKAKVTHLEQFGCFVDIGCGLPSLIPIDSISVSRISHPSDRFYIGQQIFAAVRSITDEKITLTHKELLGTWEENAGAYSSGETVTGIIRSIENYGVFVELTPNLAGLAEIHPDAGINRHASVYIKSIIPEKMKIKLIIVDTFDSGFVSHSWNYFFEGKHIDSWHYSTAGAEKLIETIF